MSLKAQGQGDQRILPCEHALGSRLHHRPGCVPGAKAKDRADHVGEGLGTKSPFDPALKARHFSLF